MQLCANMQALHRNCSHGETHYVSFRIEKAKNESKRFISDKMSTLSERFSKAFCREYETHRWPRLKKGQRGYSPREWTEQMYKILEKTARRLGLKRKRTELRRLDLTWYKGNEDTPEIIVEHENGYRGIWREEIPKLLSSNADLKVLICYPPKKEYWDIAQRFTDKLNKEKNLTIIIVTHNLNLALQYANKILLLDKGKIAKSGQPADIINEDTLRKYFLIESRIMDIGEEHHILVRPGGQDKFLYNG